MSAQNQAWAGPPLYFGTKLKALSAHLCPKMLEGEEKPQYCMATNQERLPQPQGGGDTDTSGGEGLYVENFMATPLLQSLCCCAQGAVRVPRSNVMKGLSKENMMLSLCLVTPDTNGDGHHPGA